MNILICKIFGNMKINIKWMRAEANPPDRNVPEIKTSKMHHKGFCCFPVSRHFLYSVFKK